MAQKLKHLNALGTQQVRFCSKGLVLAGRGLGAVIIVRQQYFHDARNKGRPLALRMPRKAAYPKPSIAKCRLPNQAT